MKFNQLLVAFVGAAICATAQIPDFTPPTPLIGAAQHNDTAEVKRLLAAGANPNEGRFIGGVTPVFFAFVYNNKEMADAMIAKGADVKEVDAAGSTTLMWAAYNEYGDPTLVKLLLDHGVDPNVKNKMGETALMWASKRGYTPVVELLKAAGASENEQIRASVQKAVALLQKSGPEFVKVSGCTSCHNQALPQMVYSLSRERGLSVDAQISDKQVKAVMAMFKPAAPAMAAGMPNFPDPAISVSYSLLGLAAEGYAPDATTDAMAHLVSIQQLPNGAFNVFAARPPIESSLFTGTALSIRALQAYGKNSEAQIEKAEQWLETAEARTNEDRVMQILGLAWAKGNSERIQTLAKELIAQQRPDGGWAQLPNVETDAYATGQVLFALAVSKSVDTKDPVYQKGVSYLLRTQLNDGSWFVRSRTFPFQPYKESGFPHGRNQWISAAGTSWAAMALALTQPRVQQISQVAPELRER